jgi:ATP-dependent DNA ligase
MTAVRWNNSSRVIAAPGFIEPALPTVAMRPPAGERWVHEIKHDGYRLMIKRYGENVRIFTRRGADWTKRFPAIVQAALKVKAKSFYIDGEGAVCDDNGLAVFDRLHSKGYDEAAHLFAFDLLELDGIDIRRLPLWERKQRLRKLISRRKSGILYNEHIEDDGETIFRHACQIGCEGIVSKRLDLPYTSGRVKSWIKVKNPKAPAALRIEDGTF